MHCRQKLPCPPPSIDPAKGLSFCGSCGSFMTTNRFPERTSQHAYKRIPRKRSVLLSLLVVLVDLVDLSLPGSHPKGLSFCGSCGSFVATNRFPERTSQHAYKRIHAKGLPFWGFTQKVCPFGDSRNRSVLLSLFVVLAD